VYFNNFFAGSESVVKIPFRSKKGTFFIAQKCMLITINSISRFTLKAYLNTLFYRTVGSKKCI